MIRLRYTVDFLRLVWITALIHNEVLVYWISAGICHHYGYGVNQSYNNRDNIMIIADPQMTDDLSYDRPWILLQITKFLSGQYIRRNYKQLRWTANPSEVFIIGDLMDHGRDWDDAKYQKEVIRFHSLFGNTDHLHYMAGNHDIGFGDGIRPEIVDRFQEYFGPTSYIVNTQSGYSFIVLDTVSMSSSDPIIQKHGFDILNTVLPENPRILLTHVPLYRPPNTQCGSLRQHPNVIVNNKGYQYQNMISPDLSTLILDAIKPIAVYSGDDHDYCRVYHGSNRTIETTVPTFSMSQGLKYPGLVFLDVSEQPFKSKLCLLPDEVSLLFIYGYIFIFSLFILIVAHIILGMKSRRNYFQLSSEELGKPVNSQHPLLGISSLFYSIRDVAVVVIITYVLCTVIY
ncbi:Metallo-dependent phosphatase-like protein [Pilobolus umbonatus]|nr:Metallo-dependent phosphatase-like protein [Pilobolus umbonatus]